MNITGLEVQRVEETNSIVMIEGCGCHVTMGDLGIRHDLWILTLIRVAFQTSVTSPPCLQAADKL